MMDPRTEPHTLDPDIAYLVGALSGAKGLLEQAAATMAAFASASDVSASSIPDGPPVSRWEHAEALADARSGFATMLETMREEVGRNADVLRRRLSPADRAALEALEARVSAR